MSEKPSALPLISKIFLQQWKNFSLTKEVFQSVKPKLTNMNSVN